MNVNDIIKKLTNCINGDCNECEYSDMPDNECVDKVLENALKALKEVNDIVHCNGCIYRQGYECYLNHDQYGNRRFVTPDGFCAWGKKKVSE